MTKQPDFEPDICNPREGGDQSELLYSEFNTSLSYLRKLNIKKKKKTKLVHTRHALHRFPKQHWEHTHSSLTKVLCFYFEKMFPYSTNGCGFIWGILLFESSYFCYALTPLYLFCLLVWLFKKCLFAGLYALMNINFICRTIKRNWGRGGRSLKERKTQWPERPVVF